MNEQNYTSPEVSKKLVENGIVLETDAVWVKWYFDGSTLNDRNPYEWRLVYKSLVEADRETIPACSFAELQRELPSLIHKHQLTIKSEVSKVIVGYSCREDWLYYVRNTNPADALAELLMFVRRDK